MTVTLITDVLPDERFTAGQVLQKMISFLGVDRVQIFWLNQSHLPEPPEGSSLYDVQGEYRFELPPFLGGPLDRVVTWFGRSSRPSLFLQLVLTAWHCLYITASLVRKSRKKEDVLWIVLQGEKLLTIYWLLSRFESRRIVLQQWDPLSWWMGNRNHRPWLIRLMKRFLQNLQRRVWMNVVPSPQWETELKSAGLPALRIDNFFTLNELRRSGELVRVSTPGVLNAVFIGQLYASAELNRCLALLVANAAKLQLSVVLHYFGAGPCCNLGNVEVVSHGFHSRAALIAAIAKWDLAIVPYPSEKKFAETAKLSFPSKSRVYVAAGLPILAHAPEASSVHQFFSRYYSPYYVNADLKPDFVDFVRDCNDVSPLKTRTRRDFAERLATEWFSADAEVGRLAALLGLGKGGHGNAQ